MRCAASSIDPSKWIRGPVAREIRRRFTPTPARLSGSWAGAHSTRTLPKPLPTPGVGSCSIPTVTTTDTQGSPPHLRSLVGRKPRRRGVTAGREQARAFPAGARQHCRLEREPQARAGPALTRERPATGAPKTRKHLLRSLALPRLSPRVFSRGGGRARCACDERWCVGQADERTGAQPVYCQCRASCLTRCPVRLLEAREETAPLVAYPSLSARRARIGRGRRAQAEGRARRGWASILLARVLRCAAATVDADVR